jgi:hypothetical protein
VPYSADVNLRDAGAVIELFHAASTQLLRSPLRQGSIDRLPARGRLLLTGDLHDNPVHLNKIVRLAKLEQSTDHHVVLHEMIHGDHLINHVDLSHRMLARAAELVLRFPDQVHPLLANHELAQMTGKGVTKGAGNSVELFNDGLDFVFGDDAVEVAQAIARFILAMPLGLQTDTGVFCSHSLPSPRVMDRFDATVIDRVLCVDDYIAPFGAAHLMVWGRNHTHNQLEELARRWDVKLFCIGHEHASSGLEAKFERLLILNSDHEQGRVVPLALTQPPPSAIEMLLHAVPLMSLQ